MKVAGQRNDDYCKHLSGFNALHFPYYVDFTKIEAINPYMQ